MYISINRNKLIKADVWFFLSLNSTMSYDFKYTPFLCIYQKSISSKNEQARYERLIEISDQRVSASVSQWVSVLSVSLRTHWKKRGSSMIL